ncbi:hypothetical protein [Pseudomonas sp.]|uniref:hypothetical protein n=1 Tax=Pseudomonas sp. TaxID=306 RepID=UPI002BE9818D|nr:hypothetical protein [Pseudomonas sp.]HUE91251.1 hypothetical protein [Pseudomonas sp.]
MTPVVPFYLLASCKSWHADSFIRLRQRTDERWQWVQSPDELLAVLDGAVPRYIFFLHWRWRVPESIWREHECVCFHMTDLPYGRGGSPLQNLIADGHHETRLSALRMVEMLDAGPIYLKQSLSLQGTAEAIYVRAGELGEQMIAEIIARQPQVVEQQGEVVLFKRRTPQQSALPYRGELMQLYDHIRMLDAPGYPRAFIEHGEFRLEFSAVQLEGEQLHATVVLRRRSEPQE